MEQVRLERWLDEVRQHPELGGEPLCQQLAASLYCMVAWPEQVGGRRLVSVDRLAGWCQVDVGEVMSALVEMEPVLDQLRRMVGSAASDPAGEVGPEAPDMTLW